MALSLRPVSGVPITAPRRTTLDTRVSSGTGADGSAPAVTAPAVTAQTAASTTNGAWPTDPNGNPLPITPQQLQTLSNVANQVASDVGASESGSSALNDFEQKLTSSGVFTADQVQDIIGSISSQFGGTLQDKNGGNTNQFVGGWVSTATGALQNALAALNPNPLTSPPGSAGTPTTSTSGSSSSTGSLDDEQNTLLEDLIGLLPSLGSSSAGGNGTSGSTGSLATAPSEPLYTVGADQSAPSSGGGNPLGLVLIGAAAIGGFIYWHHMHHGSPLHESTGHE